ncbi:MAG: undecaprenyl-diphosphate phosphatase [Candidatus Paracaedibacteraceae bacterium]|nr:undecaprenyl-diphosphate phosphatase [Candidatus Paracaedibacteraceae bacterium]
MSYLAILVLSFIQGLTEFLPVSSSGHLILAPKLFGWPDQGLEMDVAVHLGTLLSVILYFRKDIKDLLQHFFRYVGSGFRQEQFTPETKLSLILIIATLPAVIVGLGLKKMGMDIMRSTQLIAITSIIFGILMYIADRRPQFLGLDKINWGSGFVIGIAQAIALIPGTSRSGICMTAARAMGFDRITSARFAFLLSIPSILGAGLLTTLDALKEGHNVFNATFGIALGLSFLFGLAAIHFMLSFLMRHGLGVFTLYRVLLGIILLTIM